jgi:hypothetical protein
MSISKKKNTIFLLLLVITIIAVRPNLSNAQIGNTQPPSSESGVGNSNGPFGGSASGSTNADADEDDDPGGPTDPPDDVVPLDGGVSILLAIGLVHGYLISRRRKKETQPVPVHYTGR